MLRCCPVRQPLAVEPAEGPPAITVDRSSPIPLYYQIARQLEAAIDSGQFAAGSHLPSEVELAQRLAISRPTVRQAIERLIEQGLVARRRGIGTCVVPRRVRRAVQLTSLHDDLVASGRRPTTTVLALARGPAQGAIAQALNVAEGTPVVHLQRLRCADGAPLGLMHNHLPADLVTLDAASLEAQGLYALLRARGLYPQVAEQTIGARPASSEEARLLATRPRQSLLTITRTAYSSAGRPIEYGHHCYRADRYTFEIRLVSG